MLLAHLLKWEHQPDQRSAGWLGIIVEQRRQMGAVLADAPSLAKVLEAALVAAFADARDDASRETGLAPEVFPQDCPYTVEQILDKTFMPGEAAGN